MSKREQLKQSQHFADLHEVQPTESNEQVVELDPPSDEARHNEEDSESEGEADLNPEVLREKYAKRIHKAADTIDNIEDVFDKLTDNSYANKVGDANNIDEAIDTLEKHISHMNAVLIALIKAKQMEEQREILLNKVGYYDYIKQEEPNKEDESAIAASSS